MQTLLWKTNTTAARIQSFVNFVAEREAIRLKKEAGLPRPWTKDSVLHEHSFCNVRRADDRVTQWIGEWISDWLPKDRWFACAVARWINEPDTLGDLPKHWDPLLYRKMLKAKSDAGVRIFRAAYIINGYPGIAKYESVVTKVLNPLWKAKVEPPSNYQQAWTLLRQHAGQGPFMAGQIAFDWHTFDLVTFEDAKEWAPLGPGSIKGLNIIYNGNPEAKKPSQTQGVIWMRELFEVLRDRQPTIARRLDLHDVQNCCCEFQKYCRGSSKQKYVPFTEKFL